MLAEHPSSNLAHCRIKTIERDGSIKRIVSPFPEVQSAMDFVHDIYYYERSILIPDFMFRTDALKAIGGFAGSPLAWGSDYITVAKVALHGGGGTSSILPRHSFRGGSQD